MRLRGSLDARVKAIMKKGGLSQRDAQKNLQKQAKNVRYIFNISHAEWGKASSHDITLKSGKYGVVNINDFLIDIVKADIPM